MTTLSPSPENVLLGKGKLFFDRFDANDAKQGFFHLGNCSTFELSTEDDVVENQNSMIAAGGVYKSVTRARTININVTGFEFSTQNLAIALMGSVQTVSAQTTGTATAEAVSTNGQKGRYYRTTKRNITVTKVTAGTAVGTPTATLTATTDYTTYDAATGIIQLTAAAGITAGDVIEVDYTYATFAATEAIWGGKSSKIEGTLLYAPDPATGPSWEITAWKVSFNPNGATGFITDDFGTWQVTGKVLDDSLGTYGGSANSPYYTATQV